MNKVPPIGVFFAAACLALMLAIPFVAPHSGTTRSEANPSAAARAPRAGTATGTPAAAGTAAGGVEVDDAARDHDHEVPATDPHWYVTMHGEGALAQVYAIDGNGKVIGPVLGPLPADQPAMDELRGMIVLGDGKLAVMNAKSTATRVMLFGAPDATTGIRPFAGIWTQKSDANPALVHPYQIAIGPDGNLYAGNQDTNTITRYYGLGNPKRGQPMPLPEGLAEFGTLPPGTVVPNDQQSPEGIGLVRGFAFGPDGNIYVCDRGRSRVAVYDPRTGRYLRSVLTADAGLKHPIQVLFSDDGDSLFVTDNSQDCVFRVDMSSGKPRLLVQPKAGGLDAASSLAVRSHVMYVGSRLGKEILKFDLKTGKFLGSFAKLASNPEFFVPVNQQ